MRGNHWVGGLEKGLKGGGQCVGRETLGSGDLLLSQQAEGSRLRPRR